MKLESLSAHGASQKSAKRYFANCILSSKLLQFVPFVCIARLKQPYQMTVTNTNPLL